MQPVDVLRYHRAQSPELFPPREHLVSGVWTCVGEISMRLALLSPVFVPGRSAGHEVVVQDRLILGPNTAGRTKIGDAAFGADAGPCECHHTLGLC